MVIWVDSQLVLWYYGRMSNEQQLEKSLDTISFVISHLQELQRLVGEPRYEDVIERLQSDWNQLFNQINIEFD